MTITTRTLALMLAISLMVWTAPARAQQPQMNLPRIMLQAGMFQIDTQVAQAPEQRSVGLMWRREMPMHEGEIGFGYLAGSEEVFELPIPEQEAPSVAVTLAQAPQILATDFVHVLVADLVAVEEVVPEGLFVAPAVAQAQFLVRTPPIVTSSALVSAVAADFDGDGDADIVGYANVFAAGLPAMRMLRNDGQEMFTDVTSTHLPPQGFSLNQPSDIAAFDQDGDGDVDVLVSFQLDSGSLFHNDGTGHFTNATAGLQDYPYGLREIAVADMDQDNDLDAVGILTTLGGSATMFRNLGGGTFDILFFPWSGASALALVDIDNDNDHDVVMVSGTNLLVPRNEGGLAFTNVSATWANGIVSPPSRTLAAADLDGDGDRDLVAGGVSGSPDTVLRNDGASFTPVGSIAPGGTTTRCLGLVDVDGDGDPDAIRGHEAACTIAINDGAGNLTLAPSRISAPSISVTDVLVADLDRDTDADLLTMGPAGSQLLVNRQYDLRPGHPVVGQTWTVEIWSQPGYAARDHLATLGISLGALPQPVTFGPYGDLWLDPALIVLLPVWVVQASTGVATATIAVPNLPLVGLPLAVQAAVAPTPLPLHLTAYFGVIVQ
jgi:hypothetical protein